VNDERTAENVKRNRSALARQRRAAKDEAGRPAPRTTPADARQMEELRRRKEEPRYWEGGTTCL